MHGHRQTERLTDPREALRRTLTYLKNNEPRMNYSNTASKAFPVIEHGGVLIKEINYRVKGTEKFWDNPEGAEAILGQAAALLSDDDRFGWITSPIARAPRFAVTRRGSLRKLYNYSGIADQVLHSSSKPSSHPSLVN